MKLTRIAQPLFFMGIILSGFWFPGSALTGMLLLIATAIGCQSIFSRHFWKEYALSKLMLVYLAWLVVVAISSSVPNTAMLTTAVLAGLPVMYLIASNTNNFSEIWKSTRIALFLLAIGFSVWAIWQVVNHVGYGQAVGPLLDRNAFAALLNLLWFPAVYLFLTNKSTSQRWIQPLIGIGLFVISTAFFATTSRGGIATWLLLIPFILWAGYQHTKSKQQVSIILFIAIAAYLTSALALHSTIADRTFQLSQDASTSARLMLWESSIKMTLSHPFFGTGWGTFGFYYPAYRLPLENSTSGLFSHNDYLQYAAEGGVFSLLLLLSMLFGLCLQLKRSLESAVEAAGLESIALLLGVLALFIQAGVNFIFYFAFMNIIAGLYLARASQLIDKQQAIKISDFDKVRPSVKRLLAGFIALIVAAPFALHLIAQACLTGLQPGLTAINLIAPKVTSYNIASFITAIRPQEDIGQEAMIQTAENFLANNINNHKSTITADFKHDLLNETIERFDLVRSKTANNPYMGVREVKMLIAYHHIFGDNIAYSKAQQVLSDNLKVDPYHANSMIMFARLQVAQGNRAQAIQTLQFAASHIRTRRDQQTIAVETLRQLAAPKIITELDDIEKQLQLVRSESEAGKPLILPANFSEDIDARLNIIAGQIQQVK